MNRLDYKAANHVARYIRRLIDCSLANHQVQELITAGRWTAERVRNHPLCRIEFPYGNIITSVDDLHGSIRYGESVRKLGPWIKLTPVAPDDEFFEVFRGIQFYTNHPRNIRWRHRMQLKEMLAAKHKPLVTAAKRKTQGKFLGELVPAEKRAIGATGLKPDEFWRQVKHGPNGRHPLKKRQQVLFGDGGDQ